MTKRRSKNLRIKPGKTKRSPMVMPPKRKLDARDKMSRFLDFLNADIDSLRRGDRSKFFFDLKELIHGDAVLEPPPGYVVDDKDFLFLKDAQEAFRQALANILKTAEGCIAQDVDYANIAEYSISYLVVVSKDSVFKARSFPALSPFHEISQGPIFDVLLELLSQFHLSRIRTCQKPGCGKYFYRKREGAKGDFCSNTCRNWGYAIRWRKNHPEEYRKYLENYRAKAKAPRVKVDCRSCGYRESRGTLYEEMRNNPGLEDCPKCKKAKLLHVEMIREGKKWIEGREWGALDWRDFCENFHKEIKD